MRLKSVVASTLVKQVKSSNKYHTIKLDQAIMTVLVKTVTSLLAHAVVTHASSSQVADQ